MDVLERFKQEYTMKVVEMGEPMDEELLSLQEEVFFTVFNQDPFMMDELIYELNGMKTEKALIEENEQLALRVGELENVIAQILEKLES